jgi:hypothetical protein
MSYGMESVGLLRDIFSIIRPQSHLFLQIVQNFATNGAVECIAGGQVAIQRY